MKAVACKKKYKKELDSTTEKLDKAGGNMNAHHAGD
jgi:hypothetical protein